MSMPKDFSEDGASGAAGGAAGTANLGNGTTGFDTSNGALAPNGFGGVWEGGSQAPGLSPNEMAGGALNGFGGVWDQNPSMSDANSNGQNFMFDDGGTVPDQDPNDDGGQPADPNAGLNGAVNDRIALALTSVDSALQYGRTKHGLPGDSGMDEGTGQQAANMPTIPGNQSNTPGPYVPQQKPQPQQMAANMPASPAGQSESGVKPLQPAPGPLPPTSTPFGQRQGQPYGRVADASGDDDTPTIPTEEETA